MSGAASFPLLGIIWVVVVATAILIFRRRLVTLLLRVAQPREDEVAQRRDMTIGVTLVSVFVYLLCALVTAATLMPGPVRVWALSLGVPAIVVVNILYWVRLAAAGLSVARWLRR